MSPRSQAAAISGGCRLRISTSFGSTPKCSSANSRWKWVVETNGTPTFFPARSSIFEMPEPSRATSASAAAMSSTIQTSWMSSCWLAPVAMPAEPASAICTSPDAIAVITLAPESNCRYSTSQPVALEKVSSAIGTLYGL